MCRNVKINKKSEVLQTKRDTVNIVDRVLLPTTNKPERITTSFCTQEKRQ